MTNRCAVFALQNVVNEMQLNTKRTIIDGNGESLFNVQCFYFAVLPLIDEKWTTSRRHQQTIYVKVMNAAFSASTLATFSTTNEVSTARCFRSGSATLRYRIKADATFLQFSGHGQIQD